MQRKRIWIYIVLTVIIMLIGSSVLVTNKWIQKISNNGTLDGNFVVILLDTNNKSTKYWVLQNDTIEQDHGTISFDEKDGQTIHLHANVIIKEFDDATQLDAIKKEYELK
ncbi:hypothetical protein [Paenibacillus sp. GP183]|uniref:hypothetical protein n=1 Tax=Paenibacillus sp. GP183 TaxID=1882751 RepID=UPI00089769EA|nr:hypothetical protein [Paenibacillus sp. GP183]SEC78645.1 hypothetical protein SAMN05443246_5373 [Paenibacillus sp. GP183]